MWWHWAQNVAQNSPIITLAQYIPTTALQYGKGMTWHATWGISHPVSFRCGMRPHSNAIVSAWSKNSLFGKSFQRHDFHVTWDTQNHN